MNNPDVQPRRWFQLHRSTVALLFAFLIPYLLVALPITRHKESSGTTRLHGWPAIHLAQYDNFLEVDPSVQIVRLVKNHQELSEDDSFFWSIPLPNSNTGFVSGKAKHWTDAKNWQLFKSADKSHWFPIGLMINALCLIAYLLIAIVLLETLRRRKAKWYQLTLLDFAMISILVSTAFASGAIGLFKSEQVKNAIDENQEMDERWIMELRVDSPVWFDRITDGRFLADSRNLMIKNYQPGRGGGFGGGGGRKNSIWAETQPTFFQEIQSSEIPLFAKVDHLSILDLNNHLEAPIALVNSCRPKHLTLRTAPKENLDRFVKGISTNQIEKLSLKLRHDFAYLGEFSNIHELDLTIETGKVELPKLNLRKLHLQLYGPDNDESVATWLKSLNQLRMFRVEGDLQQINKFLPNLDEDIHTLILETRMPKEEQELVLNLTP